MGQELGELSVESCVGSGETLRFSHTLCKLFSVLSCSIPTPRVQMTPCGKRLTHRRLLAASTAALLPGLLQGNNGRRVLPSTEKVGRVCSHGRSKNVTSTYTCIFSHSARILLYSPGWRQIHNPSSVRQELGETQAFAFASCCRAALGLLSTDARRILPASPTQVAFVFFARAHPDVYTAQDQHQIDGRKSLHLEILGGDAPLLLLLVLGLNPSCHVRLNKC